MMEIHIKETDNSVMLSKKDFQSILEKIREIEDLILINYDFDDLVYNANSSMCFWDNSIDDEVWNNA